MIHWRRGLYEQNSNMYCLKLDHEGHTGNHGLANESAPAALIAKPIEIPSERRRVQTPQESKLLVGSES